MSRRIAIPVIVAVAIAVLAFQAAFGLGLSQVEFASDGNSTLRAAGYAFSIWSVIDAGLIAYAGYQARPHAADSPTLRSLAWPSAAAVAWGLVGVLGAAGGAMGFKRDAKMHPPFVGLPRSQQRSRVQIQF
jgi:hypothetical protein